ncbi:MAG: 50S ribosomal protein L5 [Candidatus Micrarchaeota archaeon]
MEGQENAMKEIIIEKVTLNIGSGEAGQKLENAKTLLEVMTNRNPIVTTAKVRNPVFKIKKGDPIGAKVTIRGKAAKEILERALKAVEHTLKERSFDENGNFSFGVKEYIDFPGVKYDPKIGIIGFDVCVTLRRRGARVSSRRHAKGRVGKKHKLTRDDGIAFAKGLNVTVEGDSDG